MLFFSINFRKEVRLCILLFSKPPYFQETESAGTNDPWYTTTLKRLKEASPLSMKVALKSVWRFSLSLSLVSFSTLVLFPIWSSKVESSPIITGSNHFVFLSTLLSRGKSYLFLFLFPTWLIIIIELVQIREGRYQTFDQCLTREYRMSLQGTSMQISGDFREV